MKVRSISVIICTHNRSHFLPGVIAEVRAQDYSKEAFEIIVIDNGSTDNTADVVNEVSSEPGVSIHYALEPRRGVTFARNRGAKIAQFPYLAYLDDDCSVQPDWLSALMQGFNLDDDVAVVGGRVVLDWSHTKRPTWLGPDLEPWLAENSNLGTQPLIFGENVQVMEGNMALTREAWQAAGGFLGMEQFGSQNMSAGEVLYLIQKLRQLNYQVAFIPQAVAVHRMGTYTRGRFIQRAYWQGVSDGVLDYLLNRRSWLSTAMQVVVNTAAMIALMGLTCLSYLKADQAKGLYHLMRTIRRFSLILSEMHIVGDWTRVQDWISEQH